MKKNGFTLVEILAVLVLVAAIAVISIPSILSYLNSNKTEISEATKKLIFSAVDLYVDNNSNDFPRSVGNQYCATLGDVVDYGLLQSPIVDSVNGKEISLDTYIKISYYVDKDLNINKYHYEIVNDCETILVDDAIPDDDSGEETPGEEEPKDYICNAVTTATNGNVPKGNFEYGDEYICDPGDGISRRFFVFDVSGDYREMVHLITAENITSFTSCQREESYTSDFTKAEALLASHNTLWKVESYLPTVEQISYAATGKSFTGLSIYNLPSWLYSNLDNNTSTQLPFGYLVNGTSSDYRFVWGVNSSGTLSQWYEGANCTPGDKIGVRPVIMVYSSKIR